jgi:hypothetical protein
MKMLKKFSNQNTPSSSPGKILVKKSELESSGTKISSKVSDPVEDRAKKMKLINQFKDRIDLSGSGGDKISVHKSELGSASSRKKSDPVDTRAQMLKLYNQKRQKQGVDTPKPALQDSLFDSKVSEVQSPSKSKVDSFLKQQLDRKAAGYSSITPSYNSNNISVTANLKESKEKDDAYISNTSGLVQSNLKNDYQSNMSQISTLTAEIEENKDSLAKLMRRAKQNLNVHEATKQIGDARDIKKSNDDLAYSNEGFSPSRSPRLGTRVTPFNMGG